MSDPDPIAMVRAEHEQDIQWGAMHAPSSLTVQDVADLLSTLDCLTADRDTLRQRVETARLALADIGWGEDMTFTRAWKTARRIYADIAEWEPQG